MDKHISTHSPHPLTPAYQVTIFIFQLLTGQTLQRDVFWHSLWISRPFQMQQHVGYGTAYPAMQ
jgi:hypothetical protein